MTANVFPLATLAPTDQILIKRPGDDKLYYVTSANLNADALSEIAAATTILAGKVELATTAEALAGTSSTLVVTPEGMATYCPAGSTGAAGKVELATTTEALAGTSSSLVVTPEGLATYCPASSTGAAGKVELATTAEAQTGTSSALAVTPEGAKTMIDALKFIAFAGKNNTGACTAVGLKVNDVVKFIANTGDGGSGAADFEATITVADQIQQSSAEDLSTKRYLAVCYRPSGA